MAFLAVVALCVSPVLALSCCCSAPAHHAAVVPVHIEADAKIDAASHACCPDTAVNGDGAAATSSSSLGDDSGVVLASVCDCEHGANASPFVASDSSRNFPPLALAVPIALPVFYVAAPERPIFFVHAAARPRSPASRASSGRAPPALAPAEAEISS